jgi:arginine/lysine/ornithine decarboxylase
VLLPAPTGFLVLFSLGITRGKAGTLLSELFEFKKSAREPRVWRVSASGYA